MKTKAIFYHAGCPVCVNAEQILLGILNKDQIDLEIVHLGNERSRISKAENLGVKSVPALVIGQDVLHINFGASLADLKKS
ncbi:MAG: thioredoxin family protein [Verrucomicrobiia bacterium]